MHWSRGVAVVVLALAGAPLGAQTIDDGQMMAKHDLCAGFVYAHDRWDHYWEGTLKRENGNIGAVTTQNVTWMGTYGVASRVNVIAMMPYVWTKASQGVLHGMRGFQDVTLAVKYGLLDKRLTENSSLGAFVVGAVGAPVSDYTPDFLPLAIGSASRHSSGRLTVDLRRQGWFFRGSGAYTWRGNVTLDRPFYFTDGQAYFTNEVAVPNVVDYAATAGYAKRRLRVSGSFWQQRMQGGGDIRRQDMPFVSNRMNVSRASGLVMVSLPRVERLAVRLDAARVLSGRNVGQSTTVGAGLLYTFHF